MTVMGMLLRRAIIWQSCTARPTIMNRQSRCTWRSALPHCRECKVAAETLHLRLQMQLHMQALRILEAAYGRKDVRYATAVHNIAGFYQTQRRYPLARQYYQLALKVRNVILAALPRGAGAFGGRGCSWIAAQPASHCRLWAKGWAKSMRPTRGLWSPLQTSPA